MKKTLKYSFLSLVAAMGMVACQDTYEYTPAAGEAAGVQVFFPETQLNDSVISMQRKADEDPADKVYSFDIAIQRLDSVGELTVALENHQDPTSTSQLNVPESVTFEDGKGTAAITVTYDPSTIDFDDFNRDTLIIADAATASQYGGAIFRFKACIPAPYVDYEEVERKDGQSDEEYKKEWEKKNLAWYRDGIFCGFYGGNWGNPNEYQLVFQKHLTEEGVYRLVNPFGARYVNHVLGLKEGDEDAYTDKDFDTHYMVIHIVDDKEDPDKNYVWVEPGSTELSLNDEDGVLFYTSFAAYYMENYTFEEVLAAHPEYFGTLKNGVITMPAKSFLLGLTGEDEDYHWYGNTKGSFAIALPGNPLEIPDYSVTAEYVGMLNLDDESREAAVKITLGENVAVAKYLLTSADETEEDVALRIAGDADHDPDPEAIEISESGRVYLPLEEDGEYRVTVVTFDEEGNAQESTSCTFEFSKEVAWESLGVGLWTEDLLTLLYSSDGVTPLEPEYYEVEILASTKTPGLYRVENPYGNAGWGTQISAYIEVNAEDPNHVYIPYTDLFDDDGVISIESFGSYYMSQGYSVDVIDANMPGCFGKLENGVIGGWGAKRFYAYVDGELYNYGNGNGAFEIVLPEAYESEVKAHRVPGKKAGKAGARKIKRKGISRTQIPAPMTMGRFNTMLSKNFQKVDMKALNMKRASLR